MIEMTYRLPYLLSWGASYWFLYSETDHSIHIKDRYMPKEMKELLDDFAGKSTKNNYSIEYDNKEQMWCIYIQGLDDDMIMFKLSWQAEWGDSYER